MKLPAVAIAAAFSGGILLGLARFFRLHNAASTALGILIAAVLLLIFLGYLLLRPVDAVALTHAHQDHIGGLTAGPAEFSSIAPAAPQPWPFGKKVPRSVGRSFGCNISAWQPTGLQPLRN